MIKHNKTFKKQKRKWGKEKNKGQKGELQPETRTT